MKFVICFIYTLTTSMFIYTQDLDEKKYDFSTIKLESKIAFEYELDTRYFAFKNDKSYLFSDGNFKFNSEALNQKLFSRFNIIENTYTDYTNYLRGCGPLEDGITRTINSGYLMLSSIIDNFVNNYIFKGKGIFFKN